MVETELAWCAGFFEGEGHIGLATTGVGKYTTPRITIGQVVQSRLIRFQQAVGVGRVTGPIKPTPGHSRRQDTYRYIISGWVKVEQVYVQLEPYFGNEIKAKFTEVFNRPHRKGVVRIHE